MKPNHDVFLNNNVCYAIATSGSRKLNFPELSAKLAKLNSWAVKPMALNAIEYIPKASLISFGKRADKILYRASS